MAEYTSAVSVVATDVYDSVFLRWVNLKELSERYRAERLAVEKEAATGGAK